MRAGVVVAAHPGVEDLAVQAEELGLCGFWVNDTPMVHGDPFVALSLCAKATRRITALEQAGVDELLIQPVIDPPTEMAQLAELLT